VLSGLYDAPPGRATRPKHRRKTGDITHEGEKYAMIKGI
jgi:hypothetical protein